MEDKELTLNEYQEKAMTTCMHSSENFSYMMLNLVGEVGEFASKVAKSIRKGDAVISSDLLYDEDCGIEKIRNIDEELMKEAGDVLWQIAGLCKVMGWSLQEVAQMNLDKLSSRKDRGVIDGNGDNR